MRILALFSLPLSPPFHTCTHSQTFQTLYDPFYIAIYNVVYTSLPVVALAILDQVYTDFFYFRLEPLHSTVYRAMLHSST